MRRLDDTIRRSGGHGDNWHMTWAPDGSQYVSLTDGRGWQDVAGFTPQTHTSRVCVVDGDPPDPSFQFIPSFPDLMMGEEPEKRNRYYGFGIIALDDHIYHFLTTPNHSFRYPDPRFVGAKLVYSPDNGRSWKNQDGSPLTWEEWSTRNRENMVFFEEPGDAFSLITVLQMGKNYEHNTDGYVYLYSPNGSVEVTMNQLVMLRVPRDGILDRSKYEYFVSRNDDGSASWSPDIGDRGLVHTFPSGWVNTKVHPYSWHPSVVYNAPLGVYMMANWGMATGPDGMWFDRPSYLGFWTAATPWGPWTQVYEDTAWTPAGDPLARAYQPQISPKWIAEDGKSFWMVFTDFQYVDGEHVYYDFNYQKVEVSTE